MTYQFLDHTADVKFLVESNTLEEAFVDSANALKEAICGDITILEQINKEINIEGSSLENLLYKFLEEFIVILDSEDLIFSKVKEIQIDRDTFKLKAVVSTDKIENYKFTNDVKAVTYSDMFVKQENDKWLIQVVLDV